MLNSVKNNTKNDVAELYENCQNYEEVKLIRNYYSEEVIDKSFIKKDNKDSFEKIYLVDRCE